MEFLKIQTDFQSREGPLAPGPSPFLFTLESLSSGGDNAFFFSSLLYPPSRRTTSATSSLEFPATQLPTTQLVKMLDVMISEWAAVQEYSEGCHSVLAPVRRLPTEILREIFSLCAPKPVPLSDRLAREITRHKIDRVAQIASPAFVPSLLWLARGGDGHSVAVGDHRRGSIRNATVRYKFPTAGSALELLAKHSARWRAADIFISPAFPTYLPAAKGNLPLLEQLEIGGNNLDLLDIFEAKLTQVKRSHFGAGDPQLPWHQLHEISYQHGSSGLFVDEGLQVMHHCSSDYRFTIFDLDISNLGFPIPDLAPVNSRVSDFPLLIIDRSRPNHSRQALGQMLTPLTLPWLQGLLLRSSQTASSNDLLGQRIPLAPPRISPFSASRHYWLLKILRQPATPDEWDIDSVAARMSELEAQGPLLYLQFFPSLVDYQFIEQSTGISLKLGHELANLQILQITTGIAKIHTAFGLPWIRLPVPAIAVPVPKSQPSQFWRIQSLILRGFLLPAEDVGGLKFDRSSAAEINGLSRTENSGYSDNMPMDSNSDFRLVVSMASFNVRRLPDTADGRMWLHATGNFLGIL
ncbi:hypothetical protein FB451DRAFT_1492415 [Mycena latifolia]|nr:hypothetical protein FB451DRAFT_1492415 [Mycena latifolia]